MQPDKDAIRWTTILGLAILVAIIGAIAASVALWMGGALRLAVERIAAVLAAGAVLYRLLVALRAASEAGGFSEAEMETRLYRAQAAMDPLLAAIERDMGVGAPWRRPGRALAQRLERLAGEAVVDGGIGERITVAEAARLVTSIEEKR